MLVADLSLNLSFEELDRRFLLPYRKGEPLTNRGKTVTKDNIGHIRVYSSEKYLGRTQYKPHRMTDVAVEITDELITGPPGHDSTDQTVGMSETRPSSDAREVFVVHGRNIAARDAMFTFLRSIDLHPLEWSEAVQSTGKASPYIGDILDAAFARAHAVIALLTPDDEARLKEQYQADDDPPYETELTGQARQNVLFEAGMAMGWRPERTVLVELGQLRPFSDVAGRHAVRMDNSIQRRQDLAQRLEAAGSPVNIDGTDWHTAGDFEAAMASREQEPSDQKSSSVLGHQPTNFDDSQLSDDATDLLFEAAASKSGMITKVRASGGTSIGTNGKAFGQKGTKRSEARWEQAVRDLAAQGLIEDRIGKDQVFEVTHRGFRYADDKSRNAN